MIFLYDYLFISACVCVIMLFSLGYPIFRDLIHVLKNQTNTDGLVRSHYLLHIVIFVFIVMDWYRGLDYETMLLFAPYMILFFLTAVATWRSCFQLFKARIYRFFVLGSTALLVWSTILTFLGGIYQEDLLSDKLHLILLCYFALHFAEFGFVFLKLKKDLKTMRAYNS